MRWLRAWWSNLAAAAAMLTVAGVTGVVSYRHIHDLTLALGQPEMVARLYPFGVDGLIVVGSVVLLQSTRNQWWLGWLGVGPGIAASVFANVESGLSRGALAAAWAGVPAAFFALATFLFERWLKSRITAGGQGGGTGELTTEEAARALLSSASQRVLAAYLGIDRTHIQRWARQLAEAGEDTTPPAEKAA